MTAEGRRTMGGPATLGPLSLTDKTAYQYKCSTETVAIYVQNKSRLTLYLAFQDAQPAALDASLPGTYNAVVLPGHQAVVPVQSRGVAQAERQLNSIGAFTGSVWIMPRDYGSTQASTGTVSAFVGVFISAYGPYDPLPSAAIDQPSIDLSSQPRVVAIPMPATHVAAGGWVPAGGGSTQTLTVATLNSGAQNNFAVSGAQLANSFCPIYIHSVAIYPEGAAAMGVATVALQAQFGKYVTGNPTNIDSPITLLRFTFWGGTSTTPGTQVGYFPGQPSAFNVYISGLSSQPAYVNFQLQLLGGPNVPMDYAVAFTVDTNIRATPSYGEATSQFNVYSQSVTTGLY